MKTSQTMPQQAEIEAAAAALHRGEVVAFPTETVYGLGADATQSQAIRKIFTIKGRPSNNPLICHVPDIASARRFATQWPPAAQTLASRFWPGPLTLVLPKSISIVPEVTGGLDTVGLRVPDHPVALALLRAFGGAVAAPSANLSNRISPTTAEHVRRQLGRHVSLILDGGPCRVGIESTVLDLSSNPPRLLRPGGISRQQIEAEIGPIDWLPSPSPQGQLRSPGQLPIHYSPRSPAYRFEATQRTQLLAVADSGDAVVLIGPPNPTPAAHATVYPMPSRPAEYAHHIYALLVKIDQDRPSVIYIEMPPDEPQWLAVRDRLLRAARPWHP